MRFACPHCEQHLSCGAEYAGVMITCPGCSGDMLIPDAPEEETPPEELKTLQKTLQSNIDRGDMTISKFMSKQQMDGGVDLTGTHDGTSASALLTAEQGRKYQLGNVVAQGGMGAIVDAKDVNVRRSVAMKVLLDPEQATKDEVLRFIEEAQITGQLAHPSIVPLYELGVDASGNVYYTMKFVRGVTLKHVLKQISKNDRKTLSDYPLNRLLSIFLRVCDAVAFAHSKGVIHRDLKPDNIMIGEYGEVLLMDWGLAKVLSKGQGAGAGEQKVKDRKEEIKNLIDSVRKDTAIDVMKTMDGVIMGTPGFMAPEQAMGETGSLDEHADIYSLGAILYNILTLHPPVTKGDLADMLSRITSGSIMHPSEYNPSRSRRSISPGRGSAKPRQTIARKLDLSHIPGRTIPAPLSAVTMTALATKAKDRYASVKDLQKDVEAFQGGFATSVEEMNLLKHLKLFVGRHKAVSMAVIAAIAIVSVSVGVSYAQIFREKIVTQRALLKLKSTAPTFFALAQEQVSEQKFREALTNVYHAISLAPSEAKYHAQKGNILQSLLKIDNAAKAYQTTLELDPAFPFVKDNIALCSRISADNKGRVSLVAASIGHLISGMDKQERHPEVIALSRRLEKRTAILDATLRKMLAKAKLPATGLVVSKEGEVSLRLTSLQTDNISALRGMPLTSLDLSSSPKIADLSALKGMPLKKLNLYGCRSVTSISALKGMPLKEINIAATSVEDLTPLKGMPLKVVSLARFDGYRKNWIDSKVQDVSPLSRLPLETVTLAPDQIVDGLNSLKRVRTLKRINNEVASEFFKKVDAGQFFAGSEFRERLEKIWPGSSSNLRKAEGRTLSLSLRSRQDVVNLMPLQGMPLSTLDLYDCRELKSLQGIGRAPLASLNLQSCGKISSLAPLKGLPLKNLNIYGCRGITDVSPLKGIPLTSLNMAATSASDLTPLANTPLESLMLARNDRGRWCDSQVQNVTPLARMPLQSLTLDPDQVISGLELLRDIKTLKRINNEVPAELFKKIDAGDFFAGVAFKDRLEKAWPGSTRNLRKSKGKTLSLSLRSRRDVVNLAPLKGIPLASLDLLDCRELKNLKGVEGSPLTSLDLQNCGKVTDLSPLKGLPLKNLNIYGCRGIKNLTPLKDVPLTSLNMAATSASDLTPLANTPLESLTLARHDRGRWCDSQVKDISALARMPLKNLTLATDQVITGLDSLRNIKTLERINSEVPGELFKKIDAGEFFAGAEFRDQLEKVWPGSSGHLRQTKGKTLSLSLRGRRDVIDLAPLKGIPLSSLDLYECRELKSLSGIEGAPLTSLDLQNCGKLSSLAPLKGMPLKKLNLWACGSVTDLSPLKGLPLESLSLHGCRKVNNLSPLTGAPLATLTISATAVSNISPIATSPLKTLHICYGGASSPVGDLTPLKTMPLETLSLATTYSSRWTISCPATDLTPLAGKKIKELTVVPDRIVTGLNHIRAMKSLKKINNGSVDAFWKKYDEGEFFAGAEFHDQLEKAWPGSSRGIRKAKGKTLTLSLRERKDVLDLAALKGMPLVSLDLVNCSHLADLRGIEGMPLTKIDMQGCGKLKDLSPLKGLKLTTLNLWGTSSEDLTPLSQMPLETLTAGAHTTSLAPLTGRPIKKLKIYACKKIEDLTPLRSIKTLRDLSIGGIGIDDLSQLKGMKLESLSLGEGYHGLPIDDLSPLKDMKTLKTLSLYRCGRVRDLTPLKSLSLKSIHLGYCRITDGMPVLRAMRSLKTIDGLPHKDYWKRYDDAQKQKK